MRSFLTSFLTLVLFAGVALATPGAPVLAPDFESGWVKAPGADSPELRATRATDRELRGTVLLIETVATHIPAVLTDLGVAYDHYLGDDIVSQDLTGYEHVFVAMSGGAVEEPDIASLHGFVSSGGNLHFIGGTQWEPFALAVDSYLVANDTANWVWGLVAGSPNSQIVNPLHYLATGLSDHDFVDNLATYYQTRSTDTGLSVAAVNGDGFDHLFAKPIGEGRFDWCINSPQLGFYNDAGDYAWLRQVVENMYLGVRNPVLLIETTDTAVDTALDELGVAYDTFFGSNFSALDLTFYDHVFVAMDGGAIEEPSISHVRSWAQASQDRHLHFLGGTQYEPFVQAVNTHLLDVDTVSFDWVTVAVSPNFSVTNTLNYLVQGLPATYDFQDNFATYYQIRPTGTDANVAAVNGDGFPQLLGKILSNGGTFDYCTNLADAAAYGDPTDFAWLRRVVRNMMMIAPGVVADVALTPGRDVTLYGESPDGANGAGQHFFVGSNNVGAPNRGALYFDVASALPPGAVVTNATLRCFNSRTRLDAGPQSIQIHAGLAEWGEAGSDAFGSEGAADSAEPGDATWNNRFHPDVPWAAPGGDFDPAVLASTTVDWLGYYSWSDPLLVADVQRWLDDPVGNHGWFLVGNEIVSGTAKRFDTKENANPDFHPVLTIEYLPAPPGVAISPAKDATLYGEVPGEQANGAGQHFFTGNNGVGAPNRAVLAFDLANQIPTGAVVHSATLRLHMSRTHPSAGPRPTSLHRVTTDWSEGLSDPSGEEGGGAIPPLDGDATWLHTSFPDAFWANPGGDFLATPSAGLVVDDLGYYEWSSAQMTEDIELWLDQPSSNLGWLVMGDESTEQTAKRFDSRENPDPLARPVLYVDWSMPAPPGDLAILPDMDVTLYSENAGDQANGSGQYFFTGKNGVGAANRGALRFDVAGSLPPGAIVTDAMLVTYLSKTASSAGPRWTSLQRLTQAWGEGASDAPAEEGGGTTPEPGDATWLHTFYPDAFWDNPGGDFEPGVRATQLVGDIGYYTWSGRNLLLDVQAWAADPANNHGWLMMGDESEAATAKRFNTKENPDSATWPVLYLNYVVPGEFVFSPVKDATLYGELPGDQANGAGQYFFTGNNGVGASNRGLLQFDLSGIPADAVIEDVELICSMSKTNVAAPAASTSLHRVLSAWGEGASDAPAEEGGGAIPEPGDATWLHTFYSDMFWSNPGGDFAASASAATLVDTEGDYSWQDSQLVADVQGWIANPAGNHGWLILGDESQAQTAKRFNTREHPEPSTWPRLRVVWGATGVEDDQPASARLRLAVYPNPFNPKTTLRFALDKAQDLRVDVFDVKGRRIANLWDGPADAGQQQMDWEGRDDAGVPQSSGVYFFRLSTEERTETLKGVLLK